MAKVTFSDMTQTATERRWGDELLDGTKNLTGGTGKTNFTERCDKPEFVFSKMVKAFWTSSPEKRKNFFQLPETLGGGLHFIEKDAFLDLEFNFQEANDLLREGKKVLLLTGDTINPNPTHIGVFDACWGAYMDELYGAVESPKVDPPENSLEDLEERFQNLMTHMIDEKEKNDKIIQHIKETPKPLYRHPTTLCGGIDWALNLPEKKCDVQLVEDSDDNQPTTTLITLK